MIIGMAQRAAELQEKIPAEFTQAEIEFGVKLDYEAGALLAKAGADDGREMGYFWGRVDAEEALETINK